MRFFFALLLLLAAAGAGAGWRHAAEQRAFAQRRAALLEEENVRLRSELTAHTAAGDSSEAAARKAIEDSVAALRGLKFLQPVTYDVVTRATIRGIVEGKLEEQFTDDDFARMSEGYAAIGLVPRDFPMKEKYLDLLGEQIAAFYDQHQHKLYMFDEARLGNAQNRIILAHELTHALQDQHFQLAKLPLEIKDNDDRALAASALVEGDATLLMGLFMLQDISWKTVRDSVAGLLTQNMQQIEQAPPALREMLLFPYLRGQEFCTALHAVNEFASVSAAFKNPPTSSAQILHPEKFLGAREEPVTVAWPGAAWRGQTPDFKNVMGEFGTRVLLGLHVDALAAERAAEGWRGDAYVTFARGQVLLWQSLWSLEKDADEFAAAAETMMKKRGAEMAHAKLIRGSAQGLSAVTVINAATAEDAEEWAAAFAAGR